MARPVLLLAGAGLFAGLVLAYGAFAWIETEDRVLGAAEAEGRAVLESVAAGVRSSLDASRKVHGLIESRLHEAAERAQSQIADEPGAPDDAIERICAAERLAALVLLDDQLAVRAAARKRLPNLDTPGNAGDLFDRRRIARLEAEQLAAQARESSLAKDGSLSAGFGDWFRLDQSPPVFMIGVKAPKLHGYLLLRQDETPLREFVARAGVAQLLEKATWGPGVAYLVVQDPSGKVIAGSAATGFSASTPATTDDSTWQRDGGGRRVLDVAIPLDYDLGCVPRTTITMGPERLPLPAGFPDLLRVGLAAGPVEEQIARGRRNVVVFSTLSLAAGAAVFVLLYLRARRVAELEERERFASLGRLAAGVAHEIRSPLNALSMAAQRLQREAAPASEPERVKFTELTAALRGGIARLDGTIREFLALGQGGPPAESAAIDVAMLVDEVVAAEGAAVRREPPTTPLVVRGDRALLAKALANLVRNAHQIAPGTVVVAWRRAGDCGVIEVSDGGPGIAAADRDRVFEPFFTKRPGGTGLGLAICRDAVERQGGRVRVGEAAGGGARFAIELPAEGA